MQQTSVPSFLLGTGMEGRTARIVRLTTFSPNLRCDRKGIIFVGQFAKKRMVFLPHDFSNP
jgi:hypothetical protein